MATIQNTSNFPPDPVVLPQRRGNPPAQQRAAPQGRFDPNMMATEEPTDPLSPTTLVFNYLKSRGIPLTAGNISQALRDNARDPGVFGPDPIAGLRNTRASTEAEDQAAMAAARGGRGGARGGGDGGLVREEGTWDVSGGGNPKTSAAPSAATLPGPNNMPRIIEPITDVSPTPNVGRPGGGGGPALPPPTDPTLSRGIDRAIGAPEQPLALPPPQARLPAPPEIPMPGLPTAPEAAAVPAVPPPPVAPQAAAPVPRVTVSEEPNVPFNSPSPRVAPTNAIPPQSFSQRMLENFRAGGGVRGAVRGSGGKVGGLGGAIMLGTGAKDIYDEWMRQRQGQQPPGS